MQHRLAIRRAGCHLVVGNLYHQLTIGIEYPGTPFELSSLRQPGRALTRPQTHHGLRQCGRQRLRARAALQFGASRAVGNVQLPTRLRASYPTPQGDPKQPQTSTRCVEIGVVEPSHLLIKTATIRHKPHELRHHTIGVDFELVLPLLPSWMDCSDQV